MQAPRSGHVSIGFDVAAARLRPQCAFDATDTNRSGTSVNIDITRAGKRCVDFAAARLSDERSRYVFRPVLPLPVWTRVRVPVS